VHVAVSLHVSIYGYGKRFAVRMTNDRLIENAAPMYYSTTKINVDHGIGIGQCPGFDWLSAA